MKKEMIFEWQWDEEEIKVITRLSKIKKEYACKVRKLMESLPASRQVLVLHEASSVLFDIYWEISQMSSKFLTKEKEIKNDGEKD